MLDWIRQRVKRVVIAVVGMIVLILGVIGFLNPLPFGIILLPLGFLILGTQFPWAKRMLKGIIKHTGPVGRKIEQAEKRAAEYLKKVQTNTRSNVEKVKEAGAQKSREQINNIKEIPKQKKLQKKMP